MAQRIRQNFILAFCNGYQRLTRDIQRVGCAPRRPLVNAEALSIEILAAVAKVSQYGAPFPEVVLS